MPRPPLTQPSRSKVGHAPATAAERFRAVRGTTDRLIEPLSEADCQVQSMTEASPVKWNVAHTSWFFETFVLVPHAPGYRVFHPQFGFLFNSYYDSIGERVARDRRGLVTRPDLAQVKRYREHVDAHVLALLEHGVDDGLLATLEVGLHHERQHQELLLTDLKHALSCNPLEPAYRERDDDAASEAAPLEFLGFEGGLVEIGHSAAGVRPGKGFAYDNETPRHRVFLEPYELAGRAVTVGEYLEFVEDGGYDEPRLWLSDGWAERERCGWWAPMYWRRDGDGWSSFTLAGRRPLDPAEPVTHVSYYEADAYAAWKGARLPTEAEWEHAAAGLPIEGNLLDQEHFHPRPTAPTPGRLTGMYGDVWEWTRSAYSPYPGYRAWDGSLGEYNGKFMVNQLVLRGASCASAADHIRPSYRNFFHPNARWQFSGIRLAH